MKCPKVSAALEEFTRIMTRAPSWALTLPIAAKAWTGSAIRLKEEHPSTSPADDRTATATATQRRNKMLLASDYDKSKYLKATDLDREKNSASRR